jgi:hypothetical protein
VCEKREVDERGRVAVTPFGMTRRSSSILCNDDFETLLKAATFQSGNLSMIQCNKLPAAPLKELQKKFGFQY